MMQKTLDEIAQERFNELKRKLHLDQIMSVLPQNRQNQIRNEITMKDNLEKVIKETEARIIYSPEVSDEDKYIADTKAEFVEDAFQFIDSLQLPPQLSLAIGYIISGFKTNNTIEFAQAVSALGDYYKCQKEKNNRN